MAHNSHYSERRESTTNGSALSHHSRSRILSESSRITPAQRSRRLDTTRQSKHGAFDTRSYATVDDAGRSSHSTKTADLSQRVTGLEKHVTSVNTKLDRLIELQFPSSTTSTPRRDPAPAPRLMPRYLDFEEELRRADPNFTSHRGKDNIKDFFVERLAPRPYMFLDVPGLNSQKEKAAYRDKMTYQEYVFAFTAMLRHRGACSPDEWPHLIHHLNQVACDALTRDWENVRRWSDCVFSGIEKGDITWQDTAEIQYDRMRLSLAPPQPRSTTQNSTIANTHPTKSITCPDFSAKRCRFKSSHSDGSVNYLHNCAWCLAALNLRNTTHNVVDCENKLGRPQDRPTGPYQVQQQHHTHRRQPFQQQQIPPFQQKRQVVTTAVINNPQYPQNPKNEA